MYTGTITPTHAKEWLSIAKATQKALENLNTNTDRPIPIILKDMQTLLNTTGYRVISDYSPKYEYFDFDIFREDGYGIRIFLGHTCFENYIHNIDTMYLYAPNDKDDILTDVTIEDLEKEV